MAELVLIKEFVPYTLAGVTSGSIYAIVATGFTLIYRVLGVLDLSYSAIVAVGTFLAVPIEGHLAGTLGLSFGPNATSADQALSALVLVIAMGVACVFVEAVIDRLMIRPLVSRSAEPLVVIVASLGVYYVLQEILGHWQGHEPVTIPALFATSSILVVGGANITNVTLVVVLGAIGSVAVIHFWVQGTKLGHSLEAVAEDRQAAMLVGLNVNVVALLVFVVTGLLAAWSAFLYTVNYGSTIYTMGLPVGVAGLTAAVVGGMGNIKGALAGAIVLGLLESYGAALIGATWQDTIGYVVLLILVMVRPSGLLGERVTEVRA